MTTETRQIEIDRDGLYRYKRREGLGVLCLVLSLLAGTMGFLFALPGRGDEELYGSARELMLGLLERVGIGLVVGALVGVVIHSLFVRRFARRFTQAYSVAVEGPYLRIITSDMNYLDQKIHFRNLHNYAVYQNPSMRRAGIKSIRIEQFGGGSSGSARWVHVLAPVSPEQTRDELAMLDEAREGLAGD